MDRLEPPPLADQLGGEIIEQFGVAGTLALGPEVAGGGDQPSAEVVLPEAVDDHPGQEVARAGVDVGQPVGQARPAVGLLRGGRGRGPPSGLVGLAQDLEEAGGRFGLLLGEVASLEEGRSSRRSRPPWVCRRSGWTPSLAMRTLVRLGPGGVTFMALDRRRPEVDGDGLGVDPPEVVERGRPRCSGVLSPRAGALTASSRLARY